MDGKLLVVVALLFAGPAMTAEDSTLPITRCESAGSGLCRIAWDFPATSRAFYWIEAMDPESSTWRRVAGPFSTRSGVTEDTMAEGRLYRTVGCADALGTRSCLSSTVVWALFHPESVDAVPEFVDDKRGHKMVVGKKDGPGTQKHVYNLYLMTRLWNGVEDKRSMPSMTEVPFGSFEQATLDEVIQHDLYQHYEAWGLQ